MTNYTDIDQVRIANQQAGYHFFDASSMRFFRSRIGSKQVYAGRYFITSEQFEDMNHNRHPRRYTIREIRENGSIDTVGEFQQYATLREAKEAAKAL